MARRKSPEQIQEQHLATLGPGLGPDYHALYNEVTWLHAKWQQYRILFAESAERIELLNSVSGFFFQVIRDVLWNDVLLHLARLTDPPQSMQKNNLTIRRLPALIDHAKLSDEVRALIEVAEKRASFARTWRNKHLAHRDHLLAVDSAAEPLPGISRKNMEEALSAIRAVLNKIEDHYWNSQVAFEHFLAFDDAETLVHYLRAGVEAEARRRERLSEGRPLAEDLEA